MNLHVGDHIKTDTGQIGEIKFLGDDISIAYVQFDEYSRGVHLTLCDTMALTKVEDVTPRQSKNFCPR